MSKIIIRGQMVGIRKEDSFKDAEGKDVKVLYFTVADRTKSAQHNSDGSTTWITNGFYFCRAIGKDAEQILKDFGKKDENGKLISRKIYIEAEPKQYENTKEVDVSLVVPAEKIFAGLGLECPADKKGVKLNLIKKETVTYTDIMYKVKDWDYDDNKPKEDAIEISLDDAADNAVVNISLE